MTSATKLLKFWVIDQRDNKAKDGVLAESAKEAIKYEYGVEVVTASAVKFDFATQSNTESGHYYWVIK